MTTRLPTVLLLGSALALTTALTTGPAVAASRQPPRPAGSAAGAEGPIGGPLLARSGVIVDTSGTASAPPNEPARAWLVADLDTGAVLAAKNPHERLRPASTLKTLTAVALLPTLDKSAVYVASHDDAAAIGSKVGIVAGASYTVDQLFYGMFLDSGNDAADALARAAGGLAPTVVAMNTLAHHLQAFDTHATTPDGLDADGQLSSVYDLALIARAGMARADFRHYVATRSYAFPGKPAAPGQPRPTFMIYNQNRLLGSYPGAIGVKTGYTTLAHSTFVGAATRNGHTLVVTIMDSGPYTEKEAAALLDCGFANLSRATPVGLLVDPLPTTPTGEASVAAGMAASVPREGTAASGRPHQARLLRALGMTGAGLVLLAGLVVLRGEQVKRRRAARRRMRLGAGLAPGVSSLRQRPPAPGRSLPLRTGGPGGGRRRPGRPLPVRGSDPDGGVAPGLDADRREHEPGRRAGGHVTVHPVTPVMRLDDLASDQ